LDTVILFIILIVTYLLIIQFQVPHNFLKEIMVHCAKKRVAETKEK